MDSLIALEIVAAITANLVALMAVVWKVSQTYGRLQARIEENSKDINAIANSLRRQMQRSNRYQDQAIIHLQQHLERTDGYHPPSLNDFENYGEP